MEEKTTGARARKSWSDMGLAKKNHLRFNVVPNGAAMEFLNRVLGSCLVKLVTLSLVGGLGWLKTRLTCPRAGAVSLLRPPDFHHMEEEVNW